MTFSVGGRMTAGGSMWASCCWNTIPMSLPPNRKQPMGSPRLIPAPACTESSRLQEQVCTIFDFHLAE